MIVLKQPYLIHLEHSDRVECPIVVDGKEIPVWFEVAKEYGKYLTYERSDGFLIGILPIAIRKHHDIICEAPVTEELLYQIRAYLLPSLVEYGKGLYESSITAETAPALENAGGVGCGCSCGVDSFHVIEKCSHSMYPHMNLTHLTFFNVGAFCGIYREAGIDIVRNERRVKAEECAKELGIPIIITDSNYQTAFVQSHQRTHTFSSVFAVYMLQKLWKVYYYGSSGYDFSNFTLINNQDIDAALYELLSLNCFSTNKLKIYSEGGAENRYKKQQEIADSALAQKYLHVCTKTYYNCNVCEKCKRTLLTFDAMGKLENFSHVFDVMYYKQHRNEYLEYACQQWYGQKNALYKEICEGLSADPVMQEITQKYRKEKLNPRSPAVSDQELARKYHEVLLEIRNIRSSKTYRYANALFFIPKKIYHLFKK